jgi:hypothetical protein
VKYNVSFINWFSKSNSPLRLILNMLLVMGIKRLWNAVSQQISSLGFQNLLCYTSLSTSGKISWSR